MHSLHREKWHPGEYSNWFIENLLKPGRDEVQAPGSLATEAPLDVRHELPPDVLEAVHTEGALLTGLAGDVALTGVRRAEHGEHHVVLRRHAEVGRQVGAGLAHIGRLEENISSKQTFLHIISIIIDGHHNLKRRFMI